MFKSTSYSEYIHDSLYEEIKEFPPEWFDTKYADTPDDSIVMFIEGIPKEYVKGNRTFIVKTNDVHYFNEKRKSDIMYSCANADYVIGPYMDTLQTLYGIKAENVKKFHHSAAVRFQASEINMSPEPKIFMFGATSHHYPFRQRFKELMNGKDSFVLLDHPGYKTSVKTLHSHTELRKYLCSYTTSLFPVFERPADDHAHYLIGKFFEIMTSGVLLLTTDTHICKQMETLGFFRDVHYIHVDLTDEKAVYDKMVFILNPENRKWVDGIRRAAWEKCMAEHTSVVRCAQIVKWVRSLTPKGVVPEALNDGVLEMRKTESLENKERVINGLDSKEESAGGHSDTERLTPAGISRFSDSSDISCNMARRE
jgi:hypothetical protein